MEINRSNYESFFIDYTDGNLPTGMVDNFLDFLKRNPDLAEELRSVAAFRLPAEPVIFHHKEQLLRNEPDLSELPDFRAIAYLEGDLQEAEQQQFRNELRVDEPKQKSLELLQKTFLKADAGIIFPEKEKLFRRNRKPVYLWSIRVAALLLLFFSVWAVIPRQETTDPSTEPAKQKGMAQLPEEGKEQPPIAEEKQQKAVETKEMVVHRKATVQPIKTKVDDTKFVDIREDVPSEMKALRAHIEMRKLVISDIQLKSTVSLSHTAYLTLDEYLAHKLLDAPKGETFTVSNLANASLKAAQNISNDRLGVERNANGKIEEIKFESRLIAFSIPFKKNH